MAPWRLRSARRSTRRRLRADFPIFEQQFHGKPLAYLDSAASAQKPRQVLDAMTELLRDVVRERPPRRLRARRAGDRRRSRARARRCARSSTRPSEREIIFVRNATEALNLVAYAYGLDNLGPGDVVLATELEHHSNFVPWQTIAQPHRRRVRDHPDRRRRRAAARRARRASRTTVKVVAAEHRLERARDDQRHRGGSPTGPTSAARSSSVDAAQAAPHSRARRPGARRRLRRRLGPQDVRPERDRLPLGPQRAPARCAPFLLGGHMIRHVGDAGDDLGRAAREVRGGHLADGRGGRARRGDRLPRGGRARGDRGARARARRLRARARSPRSPASRSTGRRPSGAPASSASTSTGRGPPARRRADPRPRRDRDPRRPPLLPAADAQARRARDEPRELLPLQRCPRRSTASPPACAGRRS